MSEWMKMTPMTLSCHSIINPETSLPLEMSIFRLGLVVCDNILAKNMLTAANAKKPTLLVAQEEAYREVPPV